MNCKGATLIELLISLAIFSLVMTGVYRMYSTHARYSAEEFRTAETELEIGIAKNIIERDILMAGYGLAGDYHGLVFDPPPVAIGATDHISPGVTANPIGGIYPGTGLAGADSLYLMGTALGMYSRTSHTWTFIQDTSPVHFNVWGDDREDIQRGDRVIYIEPNTGRILSDGEAWRFEYPSTPSFPGSEGKGVLVYGLAKPPSSGDELPRPYYIVQYRLGGASPLICAAGTRSLQRVEVSDNPSVEPLLACVRDMQVTLGLDTNEDSTIDVWDEGGTIASSYDGKTLKRRLKQVRFYILVQEGGRDDDFTYSNPLSPGHPERIAVGEDAPGSGRQITLTAAQRKYRWRLLSVAVSPRNLR